MSRAGILAAKRKHLQARCAEERMQLRLECAVIESQLGVIDRGVRWVSTVVKHPALAVAGIAGVSLLGPMKVLSWLGKGLVFYKLARRIGGMFFNRGFGAADR